jgi:hypothetical protein
MWFTRIVAPERKQQVLQLLGSNNYEYEVIEIEVLDHERYLWDRFMASLVRAVKTHWNRLQFRDEVTENDLNILTFYSAILGEPETMAEAAINRIRSIYVSENDIETPDRPRTIVIHVQCYDSKRNLDCPNCCFTIRMDMTIRNFATINARFRDAKRRTSY